MTRRQKAIGFFITLCVLLVGAAILLNIYWVVFTETPVVVLIVGILLFALIIAGIIIYTVFLVLEIKRNEDHDAFINAVTHELKTPLASMRVLIDTLLDSHLNQQTTREYLQLVATENARLSRLIENFLTFARLEQGKRTFNFSPLPARQVVDAVVDAVRERLSAPGCRFEVQAAPDLPSILADPDAITTAIINLLDNAWKYSGDIKHIVLRAVGEDGRVEFAVQDNGIGIAPRETRRIFQSFYQVDQRLSRGGSGCGLGLSIVQSIVSAHDGHVSVSSEPGCGSTFTISLPAVARSAAVAKEAIA